MKLTVPKEWFAQSAKIEGDSEVGAGIPSFLRQTAEKCKSGNDPQRSEVIQNVHRVENSTSKVVHSKGIYYRRAAFDAYVVHALADDPNLGRTKIEKITHLTEYCCQIDFEREPLRDAAGPVDYVSRRKVESLAGKQHWYYVVDAQNRLGKCYRPGPKLQEALPTAIRMLGHRKADVDSLIQLMRPLDTKDCEIVATLFAAWNDLLLAGMPANDEMIFKEAREHWHQSKMTIPLARWNRMIVWMRENHLEPKGVGRPVPHPKRKVS